MKYLITVFLVAGLCLAGTAQANETSERDKNGKWTWVCEIVQGTGAVCWWIKEG